MANRGRPRKSSSFGVIRWLHALFEFDRARRAGEKHSAALHTAAAEVLRKRPHLKISQTEIRRMHAQLRAPSLGMTLLCSELNPEENTKVMPNDYVLTF